MYKVKIEVNGDSSKAETMLDTTVEAILNTEDIDVTLGKLLFAVEEMGFSFVTDEVYMSCMSTLNETEVGWRYSKLYVGGVLTVKIKQI